jgi:leucyl-tRNA synthetase
MKRYNPRDIEPKWQKVWADDKIYQATEDKDRPKKYVLEYFPYPSGAAMHVGHVRNYSIGDTISRFTRMRGYNVLHPMGWDAFGLPAENFAIKTGISPRQAIDQNTKRFKEQLIQMGFGYDWSREIDSTDPNYYKWTQWFFLLLFKKGLAYQQESLQWWCPFDKTVLANEQVENGKCWRCGSTVEKKSLKQWFFKITEYADRLEKDLDDVDWSDSIKIMQRNWIGKSRGAEINFELSGSAHKDPITVYTTRPDTLFGATFLVVAPDSEYAQLIITPDQKGEVEDYIVHSRTKSDIERMETNRDKTGVFSGSYAVNPINKEKIPIWIADYVLAGYGTGAIMAVPAHDKRDWEFAKKFNLPITRVIKNDTPDDDCSDGEGLMMNSGKYDGITSDIAREKIVAELEKDKFGVEKTNYKMRDWLISRQRYWGAPIPIIHCPKDGPVAVPENELPVLLPDIEKYEPSGDGKSPLAAVESFVNVKCPKCGGEAERETDTMDGFACSSWYFLRFADPHNTKEAFTKDRADFWLPVDDYIGGAEHAVMHLLYARFWTKVMFDEGLVNFSEPFTTLRNQGMLLAPDGQKMSKSKGNTIEPDLFIEQGYGADAVRVMALFIGPWNQRVNWSTDGMGGSYRFLQRIWVLVQEFIEADVKDNVPSKDTAIVASTHKAIKKVSKDLEELGFNTAIAGLMEYVNELYVLKTTQKFQNLEDWKYALKTLLQLTAPFAPHITEELWEQLGQKGSVHTSEWPVHDEKYLVKSDMTIVVQINGKLRLQLDLPVDTSEEDVIAAVKADNKISTALGEGKLLKTIYVPNKLVNFVVK